MSTMQITPTRTKRRSVVKKQWRLRDQLPAIPPLEPGDRLTRREFERRYEAMPHIKKAELIEGVVHMSSPVRFKSHSLPHSHIMGWMTVYCASTPNVIPGDNASVMLDPDNEVQPDALLRLDENNGGQSFINEKDYVSGAPELIVEISASSASYDMHDKFNIYRRNGVQEYIVWQIYDERLDWFVLEEGAYIPLLPDEDDIIRSQVFPGLWLSASTLLAGDMKSVLETLQQGLATEEHAEFVDALQK